MPLVLTAARESPKFLEFVQIEQGMPSRNINLIYLSLKCYNNSLRKRNEQIHCSLH